MDLREKIEDQLYEEFRTFEFDDKIWRRLEEHAMFAELAKAKRFKALAVLGEGIRFGMEASPNKRKAGWVKTRVRTEAMDKAQALELSKLRVEGSRVTVFNRIQWRDIAESHGWTENELEAAKRKHRRYRKDYYRAHPINEFIRLPKVDPDIRRTYYFPHLNATVEMPSLNESLQERAHRDSKKQPPDTGT